MTITVQQVIGLQRAEFDKAQRLQSNVLLIQLVIAAFAGAGVFVTNHTIAYLAAVLAAVLTLVWAWVLILLRKSRSQAEHARRATLLLEGLGGTISPEELQDIAANFTVSREAGAKKEDANYFDSKKPSGDERLAEMLEENAFWTQHLMRGSAKQTWILFAVFLVFAFFLLFASLPFIGEERFQDAVRILCACLPFLLSWDVFGAAMKYDAAAHSVAGISRRIAAVRTAGFPRNDFLLLLGDYNSAIEEAPIVAPYVYERNKARLNQVWNDRA